jgi:hypothetical protein
MAILAHGLWRWRLMSQGTPETEQLLAAFLSNAIKWLTTQEDSRPVKIVATKEAYTQGEAIEFAGQVYDATARPVDDAQLRVTARRGEMEFATTLRPIGSGRYEGSLAGLDEGDYTFTATALKEGHQLGADNGRFSVGELNLEFQDTRLNAPLLRQIASRSGGGYFAPDDLEGMEKEITGRPSFAARESVRATSVELWNWRYSLGLLVALLGIEWFLRKRGGML